jgi:hypothetical protein
MLEPELLINQLIVMRLLVNYSVRDPCLNQLADLSVDYLSAWRQLPNHLF